MDDVSEGHGGSVGLQSLAVAARRGGPAPVERWNPPYCGDIGLEILRDGSWLYQGSPIARRAMVELFASVLRKDDDGRTYLVTPAEKVDVKVADAPFLAVEMRVLGTGEGQVIELRTNLDETLEVGRDHALRFVMQPEGGGLKPYVRVRGRLDALLTRNVYLQLVEHLEPGPGGEPGLWSGGLWWPFCDGGV